MGLHLGTQEGANMFLKLQEDGDSKLKEAVAGLTLSLLLVCQDCPGNMDRQLAITFEDGKFTDVIATEKHAPSDLRTAPFDHTKYDFRAQAPVRTFVDMCNGRINLIEAIPQVKVDGDFAKLMASAQSFIRFLEFIGTLDVEP